MRDVFQSPFWKHKSLEWKHIPLDYQQAWVALGWAQASWDRDLFEVSPSTKDADWKDLSPIQQQAATTLGYDEELWNEDEGEIWKGHDSIVFEALPNAYVQAWTVLGWTKAAWELRRGGQEYPSPKAMGDAWTDLNQMQKLAAARLGFTEKLWDNENAAKKTLFRRLKWWFLVGGSLCAVFWLFGFTWKMLGHDLKTTFNKQEDQVECRHLRRLPATERRDWKQKCEQLGFNFHSAAGIRWSSDRVGSWGLQDPYWCEGAAYVLSGAAKSELEMATWELHNMCLEVVDRVVNDEVLLDIFQVPHCLRSAIRESWAARQPDLLGRFDLLYDGSEPPKLLEYNADTPTLLLESSLVQEQWCRDAQASHAVRGVEDYGQFNRIDELLLDAWPKVLKRSMQDNAANDVRVNFVAQRASLEERCTVDYLASTADKAKVKTVKTELEDLYMGPDGRLYDHGQTHKHPVEVLWKLYPYEWLAEEELGMAFDSTAHTSTIWMEPPWKAILSNKAILPLLWEMYPSHPNLLPAFFTSEEADEYQQREQPMGEAWGWVSKPRYGREGIGIRYSFDADDLHIFDSQVHDELMQLETLGRSGYQVTLIQQLESLGRSTLGLRDAGSQNLVRERRGEAKMRGGSVDLLAELAFPPLGGPIYQLFQDTSSFAGRHPVMGSWVVFGQPAGICVREDVQKTTNNDSCFTPHLVDSTAVCSIQVAHAPTDPRINVSGRYRFAGQLRNAGIYHCLEKELYLLRNSDDTWMFTPHESGGHDGVQGIVVSMNEATTLTQNQRWSQAGTSGHLESAGNLSIFKCQSQEENREPLRLWGNQAELRQQLYGSPYIEGHRSEVANLSHGGLHPWRSWQHFVHSGQQQHQHPGQQQRQQQQNQTQQTKHGRKSANTSWRQYGKGVRAPTGTYGSRVSSMGHASGG